MRSINITGKHNIDKLNEKDNDTYQAVRKHMGAIAEVTHQMQIELLREMVFINNELDGISSLLKSELNHKIQGYKSQDIKKELHQSDTLIKIENVVEKLLADQLRCAYCAKPVLVIYKNVRDPMQWTLDRLDNDLSHTNSNTCIACLKCNLQRRVMSAEKFSFTKKLKINKI